MNVIPRKVKVRESKKIKSVTANDSPLTKRSAVTEPLGEATEKLKSIPAPELSSLSAQSHEPKPAPFVIAGPSRKKTKPVVLSVSSSAIPKPTSLPIPNKSMGFSTQPSAATLLPESPTETGGDDGSELEVVYHEGVLLSSYQRKIRRHIHRIGKRTQRPNFVCPSVAGSGKSWSLKMCVREIVRLYPKHKILVLQFNTHIADATRAALGPLGNVEVKTNHGAGVSVLNLNGYRCRVEKSKMFSICKSVVEKNYGAISGSDEPADMELETEEDNGGNGKGGKKKESKSKKIMAWTVSLTELVEMCQQTLTDPESIKALKAMIDRQEMNIKSMALLQFVNQCIDIGIEQFRKGKIISFTEMLYLPVVLDMKFPSYDWVLCDESQDFNAAQMEIVFSHVSVNGGRIGAFGDECQSIMMWAGAMPDSMQKYIERSNARNMPLSVCYRCPSKVLDLARMIVPHVENRDNCPEGSVQTISFFKIKEVAKAGDYILCRLTAPLVSMCIEFIKSNIRAKVKGRDIGAKLKVVYEAIIDSSKKGITSVEQFLSQLKDYAQVERANMIAKKTSQAKIVQMEDSFAALKAIGEYLSSVRRNTKHEEIKKQIGWMFDEAVPEDFITLCTVHRAKGLETNNVFIIDFHRIPFKPGQGQREVTYSKESLIQEMNLMYVAITRPKENLYICGQGMDTMEHVEHHIRNWVQIKKELEGGGEYKMGGDVSPNSPLTGITANKNPEAFHHIEPNTKQDSDPDFQ